MPNLSFICIPAASNIPMNGNDPQLITPCSVTLMIQNGCYITIGTNYCFPYIYCMAIISRRYLKLIRKESVNGINF